MKLLCDCKTDQEKADFFLSGRAWETGIVAKSIQNEVAMAFQRCANFTHEREEMRTAIEAARAEGEEKGRREMAEELAEWAGVIRALAEREEG